MLDKFEPNENAPSDLPVPAIQQEVLDVSSMASNLFCLEAGLSLYFFGEGCMHESSSLQKYWKHAWQLQV